VTFPVRLAACRQAAVERERPASVRPVVVALEHRAELVHPQPAVHSVAVAVVVQAVAAAEQTRSMR
jgi:hypothetical protein